MLPFQGPPNGSEGVEPHPWALPVPGAERPLGSKYPGSVSQGGMGRGFRIPGCGFSSKHPWLFAGALCPLTGYLCPGLPESQGLSNHGAGPAGHMWVCKERVEESWRPGSLPRTQGMRHTGDRVGVSGMQGLVEGGLSSPVHKIVTPYG